MGTHLELLHTDQNESTQPQSLGDIFQKISLPEFKTTLSTSLDSAASVQQFLPHIGFDFHPPKEQERAHTGGTDASKEASKSLYGLFKDPLEAIKTDACIQPSGIGNCYFVAALASLANVHPERIKNMIQVNDDGTYTVKFPGASSSVTVDKPSKDEIEQVGGATKYGIWPLIVQKAYGKYCGGGKHDLDGSDGGSAFSAGVKILSDKGVDYGGIGYMLPLMSWKSMDETLKNAVCPGNKNDAVPVTVSTAKSLFSGNTSDGFVRGHVYSVLDYKHNDNDVKQSLVTVRNPWGGKDAVRTITLEKFYENFMQLSVARD